MNNRFTELLARRRCLLADGATGSNLFEMGLISGDAPELWKVDHPDRIKLLHQRFVDAGADIILTNTFGGTRYRLKLHKAEDRFSPSTRYRDYAISRTLFHWETQSIQRPETQTVQRYIHHRQRGNSVFLFVRETAKTEAGTTSPFVFLGAVDYVGHKGSQPVGITWRLRAPMPEEMLQASVAAVG